MQIEIESAVIGGILCSFLAVCALFDIRKKEIPLRMVTAAMLLAAGWNLWRIAEGKLSVGEAGAAVLPGIFFLIIGFCTREKIGYGDGLLLILSGLCIGLHRCFFGLCIGLFCSCAAALFLLGTRRADRNTGIAFVPFLAIGMGAAFFGCG